MKKKKNLFLKGPTPQMRMDPAKKLLIHLASDQICIIALQMQRGFFHRQCRIKKANICYVTAKRMMYE